MFPPTTMLCQSPQSISTSFLEPQMASLSSSAPVSLIHYELPPRTMRTMFLPSKPSKNFVDFSLSKCSLEITMPRLLALYLRVRGPWDCPDPSSRDFIANLDHYSGRALARCDSRPRFYTDLQEALGCVLNHWPSGASDHEAEPHRIHLAAMHGLYTAFFSATPLKTTPLTKCRSFTCDAQPRSKSHAV
jgi:hypothetical protein